MKQKSIRVIDERIYYEGNLVGYLTVQEGSLRGDFINYLDELLDPDEVMEEDEE